LFTIRATDGRLGLDDRVARTFDNVDDKRLSISVCVIASSDSGCASKSSTLRSQWTPQHLTVVHRLRWMTKKTLASAVDVAPIKSVISVGVNATIFILLITQ